MSIPEWFFARQLMEMRLKEALREAEVARWLREAGVHRPGWLARRYCWLLCQLGRLLVSFGQYLQQRYRVPSLTLEEHVAWGSE